MKKTLFKIILLAVFGFNVFAQSENIFLIRLDLKNVSDQNVLEDIKLSVNHFYSNEIISLISDDKLDQLNSKNILYVIINKAAYSDKFFIVTYRNELARKGTPENEEIVYSNNIFFIVKNIKSETDLVKSGYKIADITTTSVYFKNEKSSYKSNFTFNDPQITDIVSAVSQDSVTYFIQSLQNFQTRFLLANNRDSVANWIKSEFLRFGFTDVVLDSFLYQNTWQKNVVATLPGSIMPERVFVYGGHHDSYSSGNPVTFAPGADDNASGTAAVLEMARVIKLKNYQPECTIKFITFAAEEYGLWGSKHFADNAYNTGMDIKLMINHDMISHKYSGTPFLVDINDYSGSDAFAGLAILSVANYSNLTPTNGTYNSSGSDSYSFWQKGYQAVYFEEHDFSPFYHSPQDIISNNNMYFCSEVIKSSGALLMTTNKMPSSVNDFKLYDTGNGHFVLAKWNRNSEVDFSHYKIYYGQQSYTHWEETTDTLLYIFVPTSGVNYNVAIVAVDSSGNESIRVERSITPNVIPMAPSNFTAAPGFHSINLRWKKNPELDVVGYNIYRSDSLSGTFTKLNVPLISDTLFTDTSPASSIYYYYKVKAVDNQSNESNESSVVSSRAVTLDKGILLVDETVDGSGTNLSPSDQMVDEFYDQILEGYYHTDYDIAAEGMLNLAVIAPYSTIIWAGDDYGNYPATSQILNTVKQYLSLGGNIIYSGYRPARLFGGINNNGQIFQPGSFMFDYLKIDSSYYVNAGRFKSASSLFEQYPEIFIDSSKVHPSLNNHLIGVESIFPNEQGTSIYKYETDYDSTSNQGLLKGKPVSVEYIGSDYKTIILSFPLYFSRIEQAQSLMNYMLVSRIGEITDIEENLINRPTEYIIEQNYPNPFNPTTKIRFSVKEKSDVKLIVYDILGRKVISLIDEEKTPGNYEVFWDASNLSSGVYLYTIKAGSFVQTRKMLLMK
ncbi:MAG: M20/M25/M40 family metallo-hydrolase [Ignavibacterium sp.]|nr:M20/M25/M40 family metallo-hydrolase [Ignavibacterium sp.]